MRFIWRIQFIQIEVVKEIIWIEDFRVSDIFIGTRRDTPRADETGQLVAATLHWLLVTDLAPETIAVGFNHTTMKPTRSSLGLVVPHFSCHLGVPVWYVVHSRIQPTLSCTFVPFTVLWSSVENCNDVTKLYELTYGSSVRNGRFVARRSQTCNCSRWIRCIIFLLPAMRQLLHCYILAVSFTVLFGEGTSLAWYIETCTLLKH